MLPEYEVAPWAVSYATDTLGRYDEPRAERVVQFIEDYCKHPKSSIGVEQGDPFTLLDWQRDGVIKPLFGTVRYSDEQRKWIRQYRHAWIEVARKNGKTTLAAAIALYMCGYDGEHRARVYIVALTKDQAKECFDAARDLILSSPELEEEFEIHEHRLLINHPETGSEIKVLAADDANTNLGKNPSCVIYDEAAFAKNGNLWGVLETAQGSKREPLFIAITTAAYMSSSSRWGYEKHQYAENILNKPQTNTAQFVFLRNTPMEVDWQDEKNWHYANPSLGSSNSLEFFREQANAAKTQPAKQNDFRVFYLNQWVAQTKRWIDMSAWALCGVNDDGESINVEEHGLLDRKCFGGLDLGSTEDCTSWVLLFPGSPTDATAAGYTALVRTWLPRPAVERRTEMQTSLELWEQEGSLYVQEDVRIDYDAIEAKILSDARKFDIQAIGFDKWNTPQMIPHLEQQANLVCVEIGQTVARLNTPTRELERLVMRRDFYHGNSPILKWHVENISLMTANDGMIKPDKKKSADKIDSISATVNALAVAMLPQEVREEVKSFFF